MRGDLSFELNIIFLIISTPFQFYAIFYARFICILYIILLKMYHEIKKFYKDKVESTGTILWPLQNPILSDQ